MVLGNSNNHPCISPPKLNHVPKPKSLASNDEYVEFKSNSTPIKQTPRAFRTSNMSFNFDRDELVESKDTLSRILNLTSSSEGENIAEEYEENKLNTSLSSNNETGSHLTNTSNSSISQKIVGNGDDYQIENNGVEDGLRKIKADLEELIELNAIGVSEIEEILQNITLRDLVSGTRTASQYPLKSKFQDGISDQTAEQSFNMNFLSSDHDDGLNALIDSTQALLSLHVQLPNNRTTRVTNISPEVQQNAQDLKHALNMLVRSSL